MQIFTIIVCITISIGACAQLCQASAVSPITNLPGLTDKINFTQYSGYITVDNVRGKNLFFWFVESQSNPTNDPVVLWMNGGPGCSSVLGFLTEHGPFTVQPDGKTLKLNPYSWNKVANVIYVEAPIGVGFSYALDKNYTVGDNTTAADNYRFVLEWFKQFYKFKNNEFYIAGESYAGHYVPELAYQIVRGKNDINFKGFMAGNPSWDGAYDVNGYFDFIANHGLLNEVDYDNAMKICNGVIYPNNNQTCQAIVNQLITSNTKYINPYNIYAPCLGAGPDPHGGCFTHGSALSAGPRSQTFVPCIAVDYVVKYVNQATVKAALHVSPNSFQDWDVCSSHIQYVQYEPTMFTYYKVLMNYKLKILVYSGDADSCVPFLGTERCVRALNLPVNSAWQPWFVTDELGYTQNGGYLVKYDKGVSFITIKGAGHMVPTYKPLEALAFFTNYLNGELNVMN